MTINALVSEIFGEKEISQFQVATKLVNWSSPKKISLNLLNWANCKNRITLKQMPYSTDSTKSKRLETEKSKV